MASPFIGEIRMFGGNFAIRGWAFCNGALLQISQNDALYALIGTTYGGNGQTTFGLPDLRGRVPVSAGTGGGLQSYVRGQSGGAENVTLSIGTLPSHTHTARGFTAAGDVGTPASNVVAWAQPSSGNNRYTTNAANSVMNAAAIGASGGSQPHENMLPFQCVNYIIALEGIFPPQN